MEMKKSRHEYKFQVDEKDIVLLTMRLNMIMKKDSHVSEQGSYHIRSIYFDDFADTCYYQNEAGTDPRAKYRIRCYDGQDSDIKLEKKVKQNGMTRKYSARLSRHQAQTLIAGKALPMDEASMREYPALLREFLLLMKTRHMQPKVMTVYDRVPYIDARGNVRVTFDRNISASTDFGHFFEKDLVKEPILSPGIHLMEVKYDEFLPQTIKTSLDLGHLRQTTFSKYYLCRKRKKA